MKNLKLVFYVLVSIFTIFPIMTFADSIINNNGIEISEEDYENFLLIYSDDYIMNIDEEKYEKLLSLDYDNFDKVTKYVATTYNPSLNLITEQELTQTQYENFIPGGYVQNIGGDSPNLNDGNAYYETTAKMIEMYLIGGSVYNYAIFQATWKYIPVTRSFDVIGFRGYGFSFRNGSQTGEQIYILNNNYNIINYAWNGTNIQKYDNGFGISMNIVNSDIDALQLIVSCDVEPTVTHPELFGSYQHAVSSVTLAQSQSYTLTGSGLGSVFDFPYNISTKYDGMSGLILTY